MLASAWRQTSGFRHLDCVTIGLLKDGFDERLQWDDGFSEPEKASIVAGLKRRKLMLEQKAQEEREAASSEEGGGGGGKGRRPKAVKVVAAASTQELTGLFPLITADLLCMIVANLDIRERLTCATCACKSWCCLRKQASMWRSCA